MSDISDEDYSAAPGVRSTELKAAARSSAHWAASLREARPDTPAFRFGRLAHRAVLEPVRFAQTVRARPDVGDLRTAKGKAALAEWKLGMPADTEDVSAEDMAHLTGMVKAAHEHPRLSQLLKTGAPEQAIFWRDEAHGLACKMKADWLTESGIIVDLKTTADASLESFGRDMMRFNYPVSASHYCEGARATGLANPDTFVLVAIEKTPPYAIGLYTLGSDVLDWGHQWRHHAMCNISEAIRTQTVEGYPDHFQVLELPKWAPRPVEFTQ